jgi:dTDP-4-amino-4,6-dideoxygalactose transaminase
MTSPLPIVVPQANPGAGYQAQRQEIDEAVARVMTSGWYVLGQELRAFEAAFASWIGVQTAIGCGNGTDAIALALRALNIGAGSTVITVSHTAVASVAAIEMVGATPLLLDVDPHYFTLDPDELAAVLANPPSALPPIRAVLAVHLYGQAVDLDAIGSACQRHGVALIEDCAQAHGARLHGKRLGTFGAASTFSFYPTKNLGALGDGGAVATNDPDLGAKVAALRQYGWRTHYISDEIGINSRLDEIQAAILQVKLRQLDAQNTRRNVIATRYDAALAASGMAPPARRADSDHVFHLYVIQSAQRAALQAALRTVGIATGIHYPQPVHIQPAYRDRVTLGPARCAATERLANEVLSLPMYPEMTDDQVDYVCKALSALPT